MALKEKLKELRKERRLLQKDIAKFLNVRNTTVSAWETGVAEPDIQTLIKLANFFDISVDELIEYNKYEYNFEYQANGTRLIHKEKYKK